MAYLGTYYKPAVMFPDDQWKGAFPLAVALHILVLLCTLIPSSFFRTRSEMPEVVTINLFNAEEFKPPKPVIKKILAKRLKSKVVVPQKTLPPPLLVSPKAVSIAKELAPPLPAPAPPAKVLSLKPRAMKKKVVVPEKPKKRALDDTLRNAVARIRAQKKQELAQERTKDQLARLRDQLHIVPPAKVALSEPAVASSETIEQGSEEIAGTNGSSEEMDKALNRYYLAVSRKIHEHWVLPEMQKWDDSLEAIFVVVVNRNGVITRRFFEKKSDNSFFNQFVEKTIQEAEPMPHFPADLKKKTLEMGLVFHPSGLM